MQLKFCLPNAVFGLGWMVVHMHVTVTFCRLIVLAYRPILLHIPSVIHKSKNAFSSLSLIRVPLIILPLTQLNLHQPDQ